MFETAMNDFAFQIAYLGYGWGSFGVSDGRNRVIDGRNPVSDTGNLVSECGNDFRKAAGEEHINSLHHKHGCCFHTKQNSIRRCGK